MEPQKAPATFPEGKRRVHSSYIWLGSLRTTGALLVVLFAMGFSALANLAEEVMAFGRTATSALAIPIAIAIFILILLVVVGVVVAVHAWSYRHLWYELGPEEISVYSGIFSKKRVHVPYGRVQTVDQKASLLQRIFGVCNITIDTAGGASNKAVLIPYLRKCDADALRHEIYLRKMAEQAPPQASEAAQSAPPAGEPVVPSAAPAYAQADTQQGNILDLGDEAWQQVGGVFAGEAFDMGAPSFEYRLSNKELALTGLSNSSGFGIALIAMLGTLTTFIGFIFSTFPQESDALISQAAFIFDPSLVVLICAAVLIIGALVGWGLSVLGTCIQYGGFHARRRGTRVEVERGLLKHQTESLDMSRVQSVIIKQSFIRRMIGYCELSLGKVSASDGSDNSSDQSQTSAGLIVHPFLKIEHVQDVLDGLVPEFADMPSTHVHVAPVALRRGMIRRCLWQGAGFWTAVFAAALQICMHSIALSERDVGSALPYIDVIAAVIYGFAILFLILDIIGTFLWFRDSAFATNRRFARIKNAGLSSVDITVPRQKIQFGSTKTNPFQRMAHTATIRMRTAAGIGGTTTQLIDLSESDADAWLSWIEPCANR